VDDRKIVEVARAMIEAGGLSSLSMRKLATELGVAPTAIYWHVGGREELLGRILDDLIAEQPPIVVEGTTARERVRSIVHGSRNQVRATPVLRQLAIELGRTAELAVPTQILMAHELTAAGLTGQALEEATFSILYALGGFIALDLLLGRQLAHAPRSHELWEGLEPPGIDAVFTERMRRPADSDAIFARTLDLVIDAVLPG
jgi:TetR/AcrR family tetracycline transcriptional repressor